MKKLVLKKDIVARINGGDMNRLRGGCGPYGPCDQYTFDHPATCGHTCNGDPSCPGSTNLCGKLHGNMWSNLRCSFVLMV